MGGHVDREVERARAPRQRPARRRVRRIGVGVGILVALLGVLSAVGFLYVRSSPVWGAADLFADGRRAERFRTMHVTFPSRPVAATGDVWAFAREERPLPTTYGLDGESRSLADFLRDSETTGLLVAVDDVIVHEWYGPGYDQEALATSFSVAKSFVSALVGVAIERGYIRSVDDSISEYVPELRASGYEGVAIRDVLTMTSGVAFDEDYGSARSDVMMLPIQVYLFRRSVPSILARLERTRAPGTVHAYASSDALALGLLVSRATGSSVAGFLEEAIWGPVGMEGAAAWNTDLHGNELAHAFLGATLRDYARFGRLYLNEGERDGRQVVPSAWVRASIAPEAGHLRPGTGPLSSARFGYGYQWWIPADQEGDFVAMGIWGQFIYVHPRHRVVIVKTSTDAEFGSRFAESVAAFRAIAGEVARGGSDPWE